MWQNFNRVDERNTPFGLEVELQISRRIKLYTFEHHTVTGIRSSGVRIIEDVDVKTYLTS
jgi:hypothetical protein